MGTRIISKLNLLSSILSPAGEQRLMAPADAPGAIFFVIFAIRWCKGLSSAFQPHEHRFLQARNGFMAGGASAWVAAVKLDLYSDNHPGQAAGRCGNGGCRRAERRRRKREANGSRRDPEQMGIM